MSVHRASWELAYGEIPDGLLVCHECDNRPCVRPGHLFLGTQKDNIRDMRNKGREDQVRGERHGRSKVTEVAIRELHQLWQRRELTQIELAAKLGLHPVYVNRVLRGHRWKHIYTELYG